ncbi:hypothetical protein [Synechococcus sp. MU1617]|uniref:hypothetical protein n=1 Tax=Synechococcus sp. MU1617 TaxID=2508346 RepID=UPI001CF91254
MRSFLGVTLLSALAVLGSPLNALAEADQSNSGLEGFSHRLQSALNAEGASTFEGVAISELQPELTQRYQRFRQDFPKITWRVEPAAPLADGRETLRLLVRGEAESEGLRFRLEATERIAIRLDNGRMVDQELVAHQSLLRSGERPLQVTLGIPDAVLTGSRYDIDLIVEEPLGQALVAAGLIDLTQQEVEAQLRPNLPLAPMGGGGLFKSVQAPQTPGSQTWALMLVHPDGVVTATKRVRVVSSL